MDHLAVRLLDGRVLVAGGSTRQTTLSTAELFDPASGTWMDAAPMNHARARPFAATLPDGRVLVVGGVADQAGSGGGIVRTAETYDPATGQWAIIASAPEPITGAGSGLLLADGRVLVHALAERDGGSVGLLFTFDSADGTWARLTRTPAPRLYPGVAQLQDGRILVAGGSMARSELPSPQEDAWAFDLVAGTWSTLDRMTVARFGNSMTVLPDGRVLATGNGRSEIYDPSFDLWSRTAGRPGYRFGHVPVPLLDGQVLVLGSSVCSGDELTTEIYDPATDGWIQTGSISHELDVSATRLLDGRVLVAGGGTGCAEGNAGFGPFEDAYVFDPTAAS